MASKILTKLIIFLLVSSLFFISACRRSDQNEFNLEPRHGKEGVVLKGFIKGMPLDEIFLPSSMDVSVEAENRGYYDTYVTFAVIGPAIAQFTNPIQTIQMSGKTTESPVGDYEVITFNAPHVDLPTTGEAVYDKAGIMVVACYSYKTEATASVCIAPPQFISGPQACEPKDTYVLSDGQGAPIGVTRIDQMVSRNANGDIKVDYFIEVVNFGEHYNLYDPNLIEACVRNQLTPRDVGILYYNVYLHGTLGCSDQLRLVDGKGRIHCSFIIPAITNYAVQYPLKVELIYGYRDSVKKDVKFIKSGS